MENHNNYSFLLLSFRDNKYSFIFKQYIYYSYLSIYYVELLNINIILFKSDIYLNINIITTFKEIYRK